MISTLLPLLVVGLTTGAVYGLAGTGLVLTYKTSGIFNFAHGAVAAFAAYVFYWLYQDLGQHWLVAIIISVGLLGPVLGFAFEYLARHLAKQRTAWQIVGTSGVILLVHGIAVLWYGHGTLRVPQFLPGGGSHFRLLEVNVSLAQLTVFGVAVAAVAALFALFRYTRTGVAMRAVVDDPDLLRLHGTSPTRVRRSAWVIGVTFAALSGVLLTPLVGLESIALTFLVVQAFGAAAIGAFSSIVGTFLGGVLIGVLSSVATRYVIEIDWLRGAPLALPFVILLVVLIVLPRERLASVGTRVSSHRLQWSAPVPVQWASGVVIIALLVAVPLFAGGRLNSWSVGLSQAIMLLSLGLMTRGAGIVSLSHGAFAAIGAVAFAQLVQNFGLPWLVAVALGALIVVPVGALLAIPAVRLSGLFLALATLGFGIAIERMFFARSFMFTQLTEGRRMPRALPGLGDVGHYYVVLGFLLASVAVIYSVRRGRLGRLLRGLAESQLAVGTLGLNTRATKLIVISMSAYLAGIGGIMYGSTVNFAVLGDSRFTAFYSIVLLAMLMIAPSREPWYALVGIAAGVMPIYLSADVMDLLFGVVAIVIAAQGGPHQMPARWREALERRFGTDKMRAAASHRGDADERIARVYPADAEGAGLQVRDLRIRYGGLVAVDDVSLEAPARHITGLIGPNGAGKTSLFNACSGLVRPASGTIHLHENDITTERAFRRARLGMGRTFQKMELCESLNVEENVALGIEAPITADRLTGQLWSTRAEADLIQARVTSALKLCGIADQRYVQAASLSTGQRRLVELARCLAGPFDLLLLDEPSSGLDVGETQQLARTLQEVVRERGCGVLIVEHDMALVMDICDHVHVLDVGRSLFGGAPAEVAASREVRAAYLGSSAPHEDASDTLEKA